MLKYEIDESGTAFFKINKKFYPLNAVYRAAYIYTDRYYIGIDQDKEFYIVTFSAKKGETTYDDVGEFQNELLSQSLKELTNKKTRDIRKLIVTRALYSAFIPEDDEKCEELVEESEEEDYELGEIAKAWYNE